jgi:hypothetical protein
VSVELRRAFRLRGDRCRIDALRSHGCPHTSPTRFAVDCIGRQQPSGSRSRVGRAGDAISFSERERCTQLRSGEAHVRVALARIEVV